jgi:transposase InsO family protein
MCCPGKSLRPWMMISALMPEESALRRYKTPEIFNTDQGAQYTSKAFTGALKDHGVQISMNGNGGCMDNIFIERLWSIVDPINEIMC